MLGFLQSIVGHVLLSRPSMSIGKIDIIGLQPLKVSVSELGQHSNRSMFYLDESASTENSVHGSVYTYSVSAGTNISQFAAFSDSHNSSLSIQHATWINPSNGTHDQQGLLIQYRNCSNLVIFFFKIKKKRDTLLLLKMIKTLNIVLCYVILYTVEEKQMFTDCDPITGMCDSVKSSTLSLLWKNSNDNTNDNDDNNNNSNDNNDNNDDNDDDNDDNDDDDGKNEAKDEREWQRKFNVIRRLKGAWDVQKTSDVESVLHDAHENPNV
ncbi:hypothetical protein RFI_12400, partial [Reticulomyxa filosa]